MADILNTPQLSLPFRLMQGGVAEHEQDSFEDITQNAVVVLRYIQGERSSNPTFGIPDLAFNMGPIDIRNITAIIQKYEPEVTADIIQEILQTGTFELNIDLGRKTTDG